MIRSGKKGGGKQFLALVEKAVPSRGERKKEEGNYSASTAALSEKAAAVVYAHEGRKEREKIRVHLPEREKEEGGSLTSLSLPVDEYFLNLS